MFINYMLEHKFDTYINVYCVGSPRIDTLKKYTSNYFPKIYIVYKKNYDECDAAMTEDSDFDIAWIRPGKEDSHTADNIRRRYGL